MSVQALYLVGEAKKSEFSHQECFQMESWHKLMSGLPVRKIAMAGKGQGPCWKMRWQVAKMFPQPPLSSGLRLASEMLGQKPDI